MLAYVPAASGSRSATITVGQSLQDRLAPSALADAARLAGAPEALVRRFAHGPQSPEAGEQLGQSLTDIYLRARARFRQRGVVEARRRFISGCLDHEFCELIAHGASLTVEF